ADGSIRNGYTVKLLNMIPEPRVIFLSLDGLPGATMTANGIDQPEGRSMVIPVEPDRLRTLKIFVRQPQDLIDGTTQRFRFVAEDKASFESDAYTATFNAPEAR
ncbi:MAG: FixG Ig-like domain-containing protein, partial [Nitratireductor sp.]